VADNKLPMKNFALYLTSRREFDEKINEILSQNPSQGLYVNITEKTKGRSLTANAQQHVFYAQIAKYFGDRSPLDVKNSCKDMFGLPILLNSEECGDKIEFLLHRLEYYKHSYESKMKLIQCLSVTSEFNTKESKAYMDHMIFYYNDIGVMIAYKDD